MKRLVFCFDGTWNKLDALTPTNVVVTSESIDPLTSDGIAQLIFYDDGVGTAKHEYFTGGAFGAGLVRNIADAYRFLIFNYTPGDEIYAFGFSRGAYTARSFVGMLRVTGVLARKYAAKIDDAIRLYRERVNDDAYRLRARDFRSQYAPIIRLPDDIIEHDASEHCLGVTYLGVWDTVGSLGIPSRFLISRWLSKRFLFHDTALSSFVRSGRHALAIDERRKDFAPTVWDNVDKLNADRGFKSSDANAPYAQVWFPGVHSSVGGGGEHRGLSDQALDWVLDGARRSGLVLDAQQRSTPLYELNPDYTDFLNCSTHDSAYYRISNAIAALDRTPGPTDLHQVSQSAKRRWLEAADNLKDKREYRPGTLSQVARSLNALDRTAFGLGESPTVESDFDLYVVRENDTLSGIAHRAYGHAGEYNRIFKTNLNKLDSADRIYPGMQLRIPRPSNLAP